MRELQFLVGYTNSGTTWMQQIINTLQQFEPDIGSKLSSDVTDRARVVCHNMYGLNTMPYTEIEIPHHRFKDKCGIFVIRNAADVLVSQYFDLKYRSLLYKGGLAGLLYNEYWGIDLYLRYHREWAYLVGFPENMFIARYEDMQNLVVFTKKLLQWLGVGCTTETLDSVLHHCSFEAMASSELNTPIEARKVRVGKVGGFFRHLEPVYLNSIHYYMKSHMPVEFGYVGLNGMGTGNYPWNKITTSKGGE